MSQLPPSVMELRVLLSTHGWPEELILAPDDYMSIAECFNSSAFGRDENGGFLLFGATKIRPNRTPKTVDLSAQRVWD